MWNIFNSVFYEESPSLESEDEESKIPSAYEIAVDEILEMHSELSVSQKEQIRECMITDMDDILDEIILFFIREMES